MNADLISKKLSLIQWLTQIQDKAVIEKLSAIKNEHDDWVKELPLEIKQGSQSRSVLWR